MRSALAADAATELGWKTTVGESLSAAPSVLLVGKIGAQNISLREPAWIRLIELAQRNGAAVWVDYTDNHCGFEGPMTAFYRQTLKIADRVVTPSSAMSQQIAPLWTGVTSQIPDPIEIACSAPREPGNAPWRALWFGSNANIGYLCAFLDSAENARACRSLNVVTNQAGFAIFSQWVKSRTSRNDIPPTRLYEWSLSNLEVAAAQSDIALIPSDATDPRKVGISENRLVTAVMLGLPTVATTMPSYCDHNECFVPLDDQWVSLLHNRLPISGMLVSAQRRFKKLFSRDIIRSLWARQFTQSSWAASSTHEE
jgi:hypothetical protein